MFGTENDRPYEFKVDTASTATTADGVIVGSSLKYDGNRWNAVDPGRAAEFMGIVRQARKG